MIKTRGTSTQNNFNEHYLVNERLMKTNNERFINDF